MNKKKLIILISVIICLATLVCVGLFAVSKNRAAKIEDKLDLGEKYLEDLKYEKALAAYKAVLKINPKNVDAYLGLAEVYIAMGEYEEALEILEEGYEETGDKSIKKKIKKAEEMMEDAETNEPTESEGNGVTEIVVPKDPEPEEIQVKIESEYRYPEVDAAGGYETVTLTGCRPNGEEVWRYQTEEMYVGDLGPVFMEIGLHNDMFYFSEDGTIQALDPQTGRILWRNEDVNYIQHFVFDNVGNMYCTSGWGPDLVIIDKAGHTLVKVEQLNSSYSVPTNIELVGEYVFITYAFCDTAGYGQDDYVLYYCLRDGSIGSGYNVIEPEPKFAGFYFGSSYQDKLNIEYRPDGTYLIDLTWLQLLEIEDGEAYSKEGILYFYAEDSFNTGEKHQGKIERVDDTLLITITDSTAQYAIGSKMYCGKTELDGNLFEKLPGNFSWYSGVGGWECYFRLESSGWFEGGYYDSDMGDTGEYYPNGTIYYNTWDGTFNNVRLVDDNIYSMSISSLFLHNTPEEVSYEDDCRYITTSSPGMAEGNNFLVFLPGASFRNYPNMYVEWWQIGGETDILPEGYYIIYNVDADISFIGMKN